MPERTSQW